MEKTVQTLSNLMARQTDAVLVSIVASSGSTPRGAGARMIVTQSGRVCGTIGGGAIEYRAEQMARQALEDGHSCIHGFCLAPNDVADLGMICGGSADVMFQVFQSGDPGHRRQVSAMAEAIRADESAWLVTVMDSGGRWTTTIRKQSEPLVDASLPQELHQKLFRRSSVFYKWDDKSCFSEPLVQPGRVVIFGGGHVTQALVPVLEPIGFRAVVVEERPAFARRELFPAAREILLGSFSDIAGCVTLQPADFVAIMTRGHQNDFEVLSQALRYNTAYLGLIGSGKKIARTYESLRELGFGESEIARIHSPIGLRIRAETPAEIAISIAAELIRARADYNLADLDDDVAPAAH